MKDIFDIFYFGKKKLYYTPCSGLIGTKITCYNDFVHLCAKIMFEILNKFNLDYYVFAGTSIGYYRNKTNIPWADDYDVLILEKDFELVEKKIIPFLEKSGFICQKWIKNNSQAGYKIFSKKINDKLDYGGTFFQCDFFYSKVEKNNIVKNMAACGLYHTKKITYDMIHPPQILEIDGLTLPFFNKMEEDIKIEYGDVINNCCIHVNHRKTKLIPEHFSKMYKRFNSYIEIAKTNTLNYINKNKNYEYINNRTLKNDMNFKSILDVLKYINRHNVKTLYILDEKFLKYCLSIKHYFNEINIIFYMFEDIKKINRLFLNYIDIIRFANDNIKKIYEDADYIFINKPNFEFINVITFGTYDLFHFGHTNILKRARNLGNKLIVGISSDEFNSKKGKQSINNFEKRKNDVLNSKFADEYFIEESMEAKDDYVKNNNANLLIMGDDWNGKFDWVSCPCLYLPRTPDISTTLLKQKMNITNTKQNNNVNKKIEKNNTDKEKTDDTNDIIKKMNEKINEKFYLRKENIKNIKIEREKNRNKIREKMKEYLNDYMNANANANANLINKTKDLPLKIANSNHKNFIANKFKK